MIKRWLTLPKTLSIFCISLLLGIVFLTSKSNPKDLGVKLIHDLGTTNQLLEIKGAGEASQPQFPIDFNWEEYERVCGAIERLNANAEQVWPDIVDHMLDTEYSITIREADSTKNYSKGQICYRIAKNWINRVYTGGVIPERHMREFNTTRSLSPQLLQAWLFARRSKKLYELQIEAAEQQVTIIRNELEISDKDRLQSIEDIEKQISELRKSKHALPAEFFHPDILSRYRNL